MRYSPLIDNGGEELSPAGSKMVIENGREKEVSNRYYMRLANSNVSGKKRSLKA